MPLTKVEAAATRIRYPSVLRLALKGRWIATEATGKIKSTTELVESLKATLQDGRWKAFEQAVTDISTALPLLSLSKIERYCEALGVNDVELNMTKATAVVDLYLRKPDKFLDAVRFCEAYRLGTREMYAAKKTYQAKLEDFNSMEMAQKLEEGLAGLDRPVFRGRDVLVQVERRKGYWEALVYYEQRPRQFRIFKQKRQVSSLVVRPVALLHLSCFAGQRLEVKGRSKSAVDAAIPVLSRVLTGADDAFQPDTVLLDIAAIPGKKLKISKAPDQPPRTCRAVITSLLCREVGLPGSPTIRVSVAYPKVTGPNKKEKGPAASIEDVASALKEWTAGKLDLLRTEVIEADFLVCDTESGAQLARFKYYTNSPKRGLPADPEHRRIAEECLAKLRR